MAGFKLFAFIYKTIVVNNSVSKDIVLLKKWHILVLKLVHVVIDTEKGNDKSFFLWEEVVFPPPPEYQCSALLLIDRERLVAIAISLWRECGHGLKHPATHPVWRAPLKRISFYGNYLSY